MYWFYCVCKENVFESYIVIKCCACWISLRFQCVPIGLQCSMLLWYTKWYAPMTLLLTHLFTWSSHGSTSYIESLHPLKIFWVSPTIVFPLTCAEWKDYRKAGEYIYEWNPQPPHLQPSGLHHLHLKSLKTRTTNHSIGNFFLESGWRLCCKERLKKKKKISGGFLNHNPIPVWKLNFQAFKTETCNRYMTIWKCMGLSFILDHHLAMSRFEKHKTPGWCHNRHVCHCHVQLLYFLLTNILDFHGLCDRFFYNRLNKSLALCVV
jgi:hypothetical protein